jgi:hypothetical protein
MKEHWYTRIPSRDREVVDSVAEWIRPIPWQLFVTLTFPWNVKAETADRKLCEFINHIERELKTRICFIAGKEGCSKHGASVPWHFHLLLASVEQIPVSLVESTWKRLVGRSKAGPRNDDSVDVRNYRADALSAEYIVKMIGSVDADWYCRWLHLFNPAIDYTPKRDHRFLRQSRRWARQLSARSYMEPSRHFSAAAVS